MKYSIKFEKLTMRRAKRGFFFLKGHSVEIDYKQISHANKLSFLQENNRKGKTRHVFKKIRDTKGTFHAKMGSIKDRNSLNLIEAN